MRTALVLVHVAFEDLGSLGTELADAGYAIDFVDACTADLRVLDPVKPDLLVVLGGPIGVYEHESYPFLSAEIDLIRARLGASLPTIGICLGAQLIAAACGASVYPGMRGKEIGWGFVRPGTDAVRLPAFSALLTSGTRVLHWHGDTFDLPSGAHHLAESEAYPNQAFAIGHRVLGLQFHVEVTAQGLERWYVGHANELAQAGIGVAQLRRESLAFAPELELAARRFWREWLRESEGTLAEAGRSRAENANVESCSPRNCVRPREACMELLRRIRAACFAEAEGRCALLNGEGRWVLRGLELMRGWRTLFLRLR